MLLLKNNKLPTHLVVGVRKGATSWIWKQLSDHPEVYVHPKKEIYYFNKNFSKGSDWYRKQFQTNKKNVFDTTPDYFYSDCAEKIYKTIPNSKILVCLRNPMDRAYSHWKFGQYVGNCKESFEDSWDSDWNQIRTRGLYDKHLISFFNFFNLSVVFYDDLIKDPHLFIANVYELMNISNHNSKFTNAKWLPGEVSNSNKEKEYEIISGLKPTRSQYKTMTDYYYKSIENTEKILDIKLNWLNS
jgi:hypothetical protein